MGEKFNPIAAECRFGAWLARRAEHDDGFGRFQLDGRAIGRVGDDAARALLDGLPEDQRNVMVLRIVADLTVEQVAQVLGKRPGAVKALQRRALDSLRRKLS